MPYTQFENANTGRADEPPFLCTKLCLMHINTCKLVLKSGFNVRYQYHGLGMLSIPASKYCHVISDYSCCYSK